MSDSLDVDTVYVTSDEWYIFRALDVWFPLQWPGTTDSVVNRVARLGRRVVYTCTVHCTLTVHMYTAHCVQCGQGAVLQLSRLWSPPSRSLSATITRARSKYPSNIFFPFFDENILRKLSFTLFDVKLNGRNECKYKFYLVLRLSLRCNVM